MTHRGALVVDAVSHSWNFSSENCINETAEHLTHELHANSSALTVPGYEVPESVWFRDNTAEELGSVLFEESDVDFTIYHNTPLFDFFADGGSDLKTGVEFRERFPDRVALYGGVDPLVDDWEEHMDYLVRDLEVDGIKLYPSEYRDGETLNVRLNDEGSALPVVQKAETMDVDIVAVHKGVPLGPSSHANLAPDDVEEIAPQFPDLDFQIVHVGFSFLEEMSLALRHENVWANIEVTGNFMTARPRRFAEILGELLFWGGPDRIMFASGTTFTHPQPLIEALWDFQIPKDLQEEYGYPALTDEMKAGILGENALRLLGRDPAVVKEAVADGPTAESDEKPAPWSTVSP